MFIVNDGLWKKGKKRILSEIKFYKVYFVQISRRCTFIMTSWQLITFYIETFLVVLHNYCVKCYILLNI